MSVLIKRILWYKSKDKESEDVVSQSYETPIDITDMIDFNAVRGINVQNNVVVLNLKNSTISRNSVGQEIAKYVETVQTDNQYGNITFEEDDMVVVYAKYTDDGADLSNTYWQINGLIPSLETLREYIIGYYYIVEYGVIHDEKSTKLQLRCADKNYILFNKLWAESFRESQNLTAPLILQKLIWHSCENLGNGSKSGSGDNAGVKYDIDAKLGGISPPKGAQGGYITSIRSDGTTFPVISMTKVWKPIYEWIDELCKPENTNSAAEFDTGLVYGKSFIFYIDELNRAHWFYPNEDTNEGALSLTTLKVGVDDILNINMTKKVFDAVCMIIFNAGTDMYGNGIWGYAIDTNSTMKAFKMRVIQINNISRDIIAEDYKINLGINREGTPAGTPKPQFPLDVKYPLTTSFLYSSSTSFKDQATKPIDSDSKYNKALRELARWKGQTIAQRILSKAAKPRWHGTIELKGRKFTPGTLIKLTDTRIGMINQKIRITDVNHNFTKDGWFTTLTLEEDESVLFSSDSVVSGGS